MRQRPCLKSFPVPMSRLRYRWSENLLVQECRLRQAQLLMQRQTCPQLESAAVHLRRGRADPRRPQWEKAPEFAEAPTRPGGLPLPTLPADLSLAVAKLSPFR